jgi:hypothetical protein
MWYQTDRDILDGERQLVDAYKENANDSLALSPDGKWALSSRGDNQTDLFLFPTGPGEPKKLEGHGIIHSAAC